MALFKGCLMITVMVITLDNVTLMKTISSLSTTKESLISDSDTLETGNITGDVKEAVHFISSTDAKPPDKTSMSKTANVTDSFSENGAMNKVFLISVPFFFSIGLIGNGLTIVTMVTFPFRTMTWSISLISMAVTDTMILLLIVLDFALGVDSLTISDTGCKLFHFFRRTCKIVTSWLVVLICLERFVAVCFPLKVKLMCTKRSTISFILTTCCLATIISGASVTGVGVRDAVCLPTITTPANRTKETVLLLVGSVISAVLPMSILIVLTLVICISLIRQRKARFQMSLRSNQIDPFTRVSAMLISVHTSYIILALPLFIDINLRFYHQLYTPVYREIAVAEFSIFARICEMTNHSINFFLYVGFNPLFRKRLKDILSRITSIERSS